jgi:hypothetical protein
MLTVNHARALAAASLLLAPAARAADLPAMREWQSAAVGAFDVRVGADVESRVPVEVEVVPDKLFAALAAMQARGYSPRLTAETAAEQPNFAANVLSVATLPAVIRTVYREHPALDRTHWTVRLATAGGPVEMYAFDLDRNGYAATAWEQLGTAEVPAAVSGFRYSLRFTYDMGREVHGSIDED